MRTSFSVLLSLVLFTGCAAPPPDAEGEVDSSESDLKRCAAVEPLVLTPVKTKKAMESARVAFNAAEGNGGSWKSIGSIALFRYTKCMSTSALEDALPSDVVQNIQALRGSDVLDRTAIEGDRFFVGTSGAPLLAAIDAWVGPAGAQSGTGVRHWDEVPCHNCTDHEVISVLHFPAARRVVVVTGRYGWDS